MYQRTEDGYAQEKNPGIRTAFKFIDGNTGTGDNAVITEPLYMAMFL